MAKLHTFRRDRGVLAYLTTTAEKAVKELDFDVAIPLLGGLRTEAEQRSLFEKGTSKTMKSKHREGRALDLVPFIEGKLVWDNEKGLFDALEKAVKKADDRNLIDFEWRERNRWDLPHYQMK